MNNEYAINVEGLTKKFGSFTAVDNLSFNVRKGEIFGFLGPNGAGKSTTIRMLCGLIKPTFSKGNVGGFDIMTRFEEIKKHIGYMSQKFSLYQDLTVEENMTFFAGAYGVDRKILGERINELLEMVGMTEKRDMLTSLLTGGWRQRLALACALVHNPPLIFLDEPTSGVDPISRRDFWNTIQELSKKGITTLVTTHYMEEAEYCERLILISAGKLIAHGTPAELKNSFEYDIYYAECADIVKGMEILQNSGEFVDVSLWNIGLHVVSSKAIDGRKKITEILEKNGIKVSTIKPSRVSLEDVFVYRVKDN